MSKNDTVKEVVIRCIYLLINILFLLKYVPRIGLNPFIISILYIFLSLILIYVSNTVKPRFAEIRDKRVFSLFYFGVSALFVIGSIIGLHIIDPYSLVVDRWSGIHSFLSNLLKGEYPYLAKTHLGQNASPMPAMHLLVLPFFSLIESQ